MNKNPPSNESLLGLYSQGKSMSDIANYLHCSVNTVVYWMNKYGIKRRGLSDALYLKLNPSGDPFNIKTELSMQDSFLFGLGLGIYWGEGEKTSKGKVRVANSDATLILNFRRFLKEICQVFPERLNYSIISFNDSNVTEVRKYWSGILEISGNKFGKIVQIPPQGKGTYKKKSQYGVCIIEVSNIKLKRWMMEALSKFKQ